MLRLPCRPAACRVIACGLQGTALALALLPAAALAAPPAASKTSQAPAGTSREGNAAPSTQDKGASRASTSQGGKKVISLDDEFLVEGQLEKPSAFYVLQRSSTDYDWARLGATMTPLVLESVWDPLF